MTEMPGGSSYFHGNNEHSNQDDVAMHGGGTELWQAQPDNVNNAVAMHGGGTELWQAQPDNINNPYVGSAVTVRPDIEMNTVDSSRVWADADRPRINEAKRVAVATPARNEAVEARIDAETVREKAKAVIREKHELAAKLDQAQQHIAALQVEQQRQAAQRNHDWEQQQQHWKTEWDKFSGERDIAFQRKLEWYREENYRQIQKEMQAQIVAHEVELQAKLAEIEETGRREQETIRREQEKQQVDHETKMAALHARFSSQRRGAQQPQHNDMEDPQFPDAPPACTPQYIPEATRQGRRLETVIRQGVDRFPVVTMAAPMQPAPSAVPETPEHNTAHGTLLVDLNDPVVEQRVKGLIDAALGTKKSPRKRRQAKAGATASLVQARQEQQKDLAVKDDLRWKVIFKLILWTITRENWRKNTGLNHAKDFCDYEGVGDTAPEACTSKLYLGPSWATCLWNKKILEMCVQQVLQKRKEDPGAYDVPDISEGYLFALFHNFLKDARNEWSRHQPRLGESVVDVRKRVEAYEVDRRARNIATSRKKNKFDLRYKITQIMVQICLAKNDTAGAATWKWLGEELLDKLGVGAMSSEEDEAIEVPCGNSRLVATAHNIKICPWRLQKITQYVEIINKTTETCGPKPANKRFRLRGKKQSTTSPPVKLPRALHDAAWLSKTKEFMPDIEELLEISEEEFQLMELAVVNSN
ncbi:hypothetical protein B0H13DRAFT_2542436 [Mycena leptocephala]|nr:hypothetical protein B0H13DRAFT_2542436 [Mycena leptocephala]